MGKLYNIQSPIYLSRHTAELLRYLLVISCISVLDKLFDGTYGIGATIATPIMSQKTYFKLVYR